MSKTISTLISFPATKKEISAYFENAKTEILAGSKHPFIILRQIKAFQQIIKHLTEDKELKDYYIKEADKYPEKSIEEYGAVFTKKEAGAKYDYTACKDPVWDNLNDQIELLSNAKKAREEMLKNGFNPETGETFPKPVKTSSTILEVRLK